MCQCMLHILMHIPMLSNLDFFLGKNVDRLATFCLDRQSSLVHPNYKKNCYNYEKRKIEIKCKGKFFLKSSL